jgi:hypothetical protein
MPGIHPPLSPTRIWQKTLGTEGNRPTDLVPHPQSPSLGLFIPRFFHLSCFLSSEFIMIGMITHPACLARRHRARSRGLLAQLTFCAFARKRAAAFAIAWATIGCDDDDATMTMSLPSLYRPRPRPECWSGCRDWGEPTTMGISASIRVSNRSKRMSRRGDSERVPQGHEASGLCLRCIMKPRVAARPRMKINYQ